VQLYLSYPGVDGAPIRALAGFHRIHLDAAASKTVEFTLHDRDLSVVDKAGARRIVPGAVDVWIGGGHVRAFGLRLARAGHDHLGRNFTGMNSPRRGSESLRPSTFLRMPFRAILFLKAFVRMECRHAGST